MPEPTQKPKADDTVAVLSALLDFYGTKATGFASLFVASVFGLVTLSAIIFSFLENNPPFIINGISFSGNSLWYIIAGIPYFAFVFSGFYTWARFRFWSDIASNIENAGLRQQYRKEIETVILKIRVGEEDSKINLYDYIDEECGYQRTQATKKLLDFRTNSFTFLYSILVVGLTVIIYWKYLISYYADPIFILGVMILGLVFVLFTWKYWRAKNEVDKKRLKAFEERKRKSLQLEKLQKMKACARREELEDCLQDTNA